MDLIHVIKRNANHLLPHRHQAVLALLLPLLLMALMWPHSPLEPPPSQAKSDASQTNSPPETPAPPSHHGPTDLMALIASLDDAAASDEPLMLEVGPGDNLSTLFTKAGLGANQVYALTSTAPEAQQLAALFPGYRLAFTLDAEQQLESLELIKSRLESHLYTRDPAGGYQHHHVKRAPDLKPVYKETVINDSLFQAAQRGGIPAGMAMELAGIFNGVIDFIHDIRAGDRFSVVYEEQSLHGEFIGHGRILAARFTIQGETFTALRYDNALGQSNFYNLAGESMRKTFLLNPVDFTRISSGFSLSRKHPILNTIRAHKGTDYAAPKGTPVVATADGHVSFAGRKGSFGKLVVVEHGDRFATKYAHLNAYAKGIKPGSRVKQGQVIGYVGATGSATGPHLHYEFLMDGVHRNSRTIHAQLPQAASVPVDELTRFHTMTQNTLALLSSQDKTPTALAQNTDDEP